jgi:hypothetical protein
LTQQIAKCHGVQISSTNQMCVFRDPDSTLEMKQLAAQGMFNTGCQIHYKGQSGDGICYFHNVHMVFTS